MIFNYSFICLSFSFLSSQSHIILLISIIVDILLSKANNWIMISLRLFITIIDHCIQKYYNIFRLRFQHYLQFSQDQFFFHIIFIWYQFIIIILCFTCISMSIRLIRIVFFFIDNTIHSGFTQSLHFIR